MPTDLVKKLIFVRYFKIKDDVLPRDKISDGVHRVFLLGMMYLPVFDPLVAQWSGKARSITLHDLPRYLPAVKKFC